MRRDQEPSWRTSRVLQGLRPPRSAGRLANPGRVNEKTRARIAAAAEQLGYTPNAAARNLRVGKSNVIMIILPGLTALRCVADHSAGAGGGKPDRDPERLQSHDRQPRSRREFRKAYSRSRLRRQRQGRADPVVPASCCRQQIACRCRLAHRVSVARHERCIGAKRRDQRPASRSDATRELLSLGHKRFFYICRSHRTIIMISSVWRADRGFARGRAFR
jgi:hypothetical protein